MWSACVLTATILISGCGTKEEPVARAGENAPKQLAADAAPIAKCPSAKRIAEYLDFVESRDTVSSPNSGAESQPEVVLACRYSGTDSVLSFYVADFGAGAGDRFAALTAPLRSLPEDARPESREFDKVVDEGDSVVLVDVNYVGDYSVDGTQYLSGASGVVRNGGFLCSVPLMGMALSGSDGAALRDYADRVTELLRFVCGHR